MARQKREVGKTGIYHILLRGVNALFLENSDYDEFVYILKKHIEENKIKVLAYVLLKNRIHLVVDAKGEDIGKRLKPITTSYARYFNGAKGLSGKLFYDRFKSEPIDTKEDLKSVVAFVNTISGFEGKDYPYSSLKEPLCSVKDSGLTKAEGQTTGISKMFTEDYDCLSKTELIKYMTAFCGVSPNEYKKLSRDRQKEILAKLTERFWISKSKVYELLDEKKPQTPAGVKKPTKPKKQEDNKKPVKEEKPEEKKKAEPPKKKQLSVWLL